MGRVKNRGGIQDFPDMQDKELYQKLLGLSTPWSINDVELRMDELKVTVRLIHQTSWRFRYPECDEECPTHDHGHRQWRHLDTCGFVTMVEAEAPRIYCKHGVHQARACGFRKRARFRTAILFHKGGLSLLNVWLSEDYPH